MIVIFDLDNCLADDHWRINNIKQHVEDPFEKYHEYHSFSHIDDAYNVDFVQTYKQEGHSIVILTSRPEYYRQMTEKWLNDMDIPFDWLFMRSHDDHSPTVEYKIRTIVQAEIEPHEVVCAYDDRHDIVEAYKKAGYASERLFINDVDYSHQG